MILSFHYNRGIDKTKIQRNQILLFVLKIKF